MTTTLDREVGDIASYRKGLRSTLEKIIRDKNLPEPEIIHLRSVPAHARAALTSDELTVVDEFDLTDRQLQGEFERVHAIVKNELVAGTDAERAAAAKRLAEAKAVASNRLPLIAAELAKLQKERDSINAAVQDAGQEVGRRETAFAKVKQLRRAD